MAGNQMPIIVSHFTKNTPYEKEVHKLQKSLDEFDLEHCIQSIDSFGSWRANSNWCAWQVQELLARYPERNILRVDCDAVIKRYPSIFLDDDFNADIAAVIWEKSLMRPGGEFLGGTMFFANNLLVRSVVDEWVNTIIRNPSLRNGDMLEELIQWDCFEKHFGQEINFKELPLSYCCIFDLMKAEVPKPVIEHFQASRRFKAEINNV
jgi:hypothetical protein